MDKKQREARRRQEDKALNRGLLWVAGAIVLEALMLLVNRYYINYYIAEVDMALAIYNVLRVLRAVGAVAGLACLVWAVMAFRKNGKASLPAILTLACWAVALCAYVTLAFKQTGVQMLFLLVPAWAGLALVYYLYQKEFFLAACASGAAGLGLWFIRRRGLCLESAVCIALIFLVAAAALWLKKSGGVIRRGEEELRVMSKKASYTVILISCAVGLAAVLAAAAMGAGAAYYLMFAIAAWIFALLVYYTVKLM